jgi:DNA-binding transcriptional LysR family regulator
MLDFDSLVRDGVPGVRSMAMALFCFEELQGGAKNLSELAARLKVKKDVLYRELEEFEKTVTGETGQIFQRAGRAGTRLAPGWEELFRHVEATLNHLQQVLAGNKPPIRLGASALQTVHLLPEVLRRVQVRHRHAHEDGTRRQDFPQIEVVDGLPQVLRKKAREGELDLVLTTCPNAMEKDLEADVVGGLAQMQMYLVCPRDHPLARQKQEEFDWASLSGMTVVLLTQERDPMPNYPLDRLPADTRIIRVPNYHQCHALVMAGGDTVCFSFPQLFGPRENSYLDAVKVPGLVGLRVGLIRSSLARSRRDAGTNEAIDQLVDAFNVQFREIEDRFDRPGWRDTWVEREVWHVTTLPEGGRGSSGGLRWIKGKLELQFTDDWCVKGWHRIEIPADFCRSGAAGQLNFSLFGRMMRSTGLLRCQLDWRGTRIDVGAPNEAKLSDEDYEANFIFDFPREELGRLPNQPLVGCWIGRQAYTDEADLRWVPCCGYFVIVPSGRENPSKRQLNEWVWKYTDEFRTLRLETPEEHETPEPRRGAKRS